MTSEMPTPSNCRWPGWVSTCIALHHPAGSGRRAALGEYPGLVENGHHAADHARDQLNVQLRDGLTGDGGYRLDHGQSDRGLRFPGAWTVCSTANTVPITTGRYFAIRISVFIVLLLVEVRSRTTPRPVVAAIGGPHGCGFVNLSGRHLGGARPDGTVAARPPRSGFEWETAQAPNDGVVACHPSACCQQAAITASAPLQAQVFPSPDQRPYR